MSSGTADTSERAPRPQPLAVRELAEQIHRRGDIHVRFERATTAAEGIAAQQRAQAEQGPTYQSEYAVRLPFEIGDQSWRLSGRIDGCDTTKGVIEEYKTTRADIERIHSHLGHVHLAQLRLYGGLLALEFPDNESLRLWRERVVALRIWREERNTRLATLEFPFASFRPNQRALAGSVFSALKSGTNLLLEAATGTGKSLATLYPAYRVLADSDLERIFFLTSRTTGQDAAQQAVDQLAENAQIRAVTIIAREKACLVEGMPCDPDGCDYARGYYDRLPTALSAGLGRGHLTPDDVRSLAITHTVCPFELSLDLGRWSDLVIMDYNYLFDPIVRLQRFAHSPDAIVLIDEAHQLETRVRDMLSVSLPKREIRAVLADDAFVPAAVRKTVTTLGRSFSRASKAQLDAAAPDAGRPSGLRDDVPVRIPKAFTERLTEFVQRVTEAGDEAFANPAVSALFYSALRWQRAQEWLDLKHNTAAFFDKTDNTLKLLCLDPSDHVAGTLASYGPNTQFSGTLTPLPLYRSLHGDPGAQLARVAAGDLADRLGLFVVPDVPTWYRSRERSLPQLVELVQQVRSAKSGNYFVAFPSFAYLELFAQAWRARFPESAVQEQQGAVALRPGKSLWRISALLASPLWGLLCWVGCSPNPSTLQTMRCWV